MRIWVALSGIGDCVTLPCAVKLCCVSLDLVGIRSSEVPTRPRGFYLHQLIVQVGKFEGSIGFHSELAQYLVRA
jgi:hypothetical protein